MTRQRREEIARAEMYDDGEANLAEYLEQWVGIRPGACDESFAGEGVRRLSVSPIVAVRAPTTKRVTCKRCAGTGWDEGLYTPCRGCRPFYDGESVVRGTILVPVKER